MSGISNQQIVDEARAYLFSFPAVTEAILDQQLVFPEGNRPKNKADLFRKMIDHATNRQGMANAIGDTSKLAPFLRNFDASAVVSTYQGWEDLFDTIKQQYTPPGRMERANAHNYWVILCKSILSIAKYVCRFETIAVFDD